MAAELVETSRLFARTVAAVDPAWAEALAGDLAKRQLSEPHWSKAAGAASVYEKVTLFGVEIIPRRRVQLARFDRPLARELFVRHALVEGEWDPSRLDKRLTAFERAQPRAAPPPREDRGARAAPRHPRRRRGGVPRSTTPASRATCSTCARSRRGGGMRRAAHAAAARHDRSRPRRRRRRAATSATFPARWRQADQVLSLAYRFEPGAADDGVTAIVPLALLAQLRPDGFDWQVPGMRDELITALLRALPKAIRRTSFPRPTGPRSSPRSSPGRGRSRTRGCRRRRSATRSRPASSASRISRSTLGGLRTRPGARPPARLVPRGGRARARRSASDRDLAALQERLADRARASVAKSLSRTPGAPRSSTPEARSSGARAPAPPPGSRRHAERTGLTDWDFGDLPEVVDTQGRRRRRARLSRRSSTRAPRSRCASRRRPRPPQRATRAGVRRLLLLAVASPAAYVLEHLTSAEKLALAASPYPSAKALVEDCRVAVADAVIARTAPGSGRAHARRRSSVCAMRLSAAVVDELFQTVSLTARILTAAREVDRALRAQNSLTLLGALNDVKGQVAGLVFPGFVSRTGVARLAHLPRYLQGAIERVDGLVDNPGRDRQRMTEFERVAAIYAEAGGVIPPADDAPAALVHTRWLLEEYRISLFAQHARHGRGRSRCSASRSPCATSGNSPHDREVGPVMAEAIVYTEFGGPEVLHPHRHPRPGARARARSRSASRRPA